MTAQYHLVQLSQGACFVVVGGDGVLSKHVLMILIYFTEKVWLLHVLLIFTLIAFLFCQ
jgi:hypothetical protein